MNQGCRFQRVFPIAGGITEEDAVPPAAQVRLNRNDAMIESMQESLEERNA